MGERALVGVFLVLRFYRCRHGRTVLCQNCSNSPTRGPLITQRWRVVPAADWTLGGTRKYPAESGSIGYCVEEGGVAAPAKRVVGSQGCGRQAGQWVMSEEQRLTIMVSSTVFGIESLLDQVYGTLTGLGYEVWMSHKGTIPTDPRKSNFDNCLQAVRECDLFLGIITGRYGSSAPGERSICHQEVRRAIELKKLRWFLVHHNVIIARQLLRQFRKRRGEGWRVRVRGCSVLDDIRILEMYEEAIRQDLPLDQRAGNWAQPFFTPDDVLRFLVTQFADPGRVRRLLAGNTP